jgi:hypothetical protein
VSVIAATSAIIGVLALLVWVAPWGMTDDDGETAWSGPERLRALAGGTALLLVILFLHRVVELDAHRGTGKVVFIVLGVPTAFLLWVAVVGWASPAED